MLRMHLVNKTACHSTDTSHCRHKTATYQDTWNDNKDILIVSYAVLCNDNIRILEYYEQQFMNISRKYNLNLNAHITFKKIK